MTGIEGVTKWNPSDVANSQVNRNDEKGELWEQQKLLGQRKKTESTGFHTSRQLCSNPVDRNERTDTDQRPELVILCL